MPEYDKSEPHLSLRLKRSVTLAGLNRSCSGSHGEALASASDEIRYPFACSGAFTLQLGQGSW
jgi:uncharacterized protein with beta-barrel porin domain